MVQRLRTRGGTITRPEAVGTCTLEGNMGRNRGSTERDFREVFLPVLHRKKSGLRQVALPPVTRVRGVTRKQGCGIVPRGRPGN